MALAFPVHAADFSSLYRAVLENDSVFAEARAKREAAEEKVPQGRARLLPSISLSGNTTYNRQEIENRKSNITNNCDFNSNGYTL
ncbi:MAG: TolC family protein [Anderseniella sp.]|nr:TolC family protein [Anderseniella sp.]